MPAGAVRLVPPGPAAPGRDNRVAGVVSACHALSDRAVVTVAVGTANLVAVMAPQAAPSVGEGVTALVPAEAIRVWDEGYSSATRPA